MADYKIFRNPFYQLHRNDWSIRSRKSFSAFCSCVGDLDTLHLKPTDKKKKGIGIKNMQERAEDINAAFKKLKFADYNYLCFLAAQV